MLINRKEKMGIETLKKPKAFIDYSQTIDVYEILDYNPTKKMRVLIVFDDTIADMKFSKKLSAIVVFKRKKMQFFTYFYFTILFQST